MVKKKPLHRKLKTEETHRSELGCFRRVSSTYYTSDPRRVAGVDTNW